MGKKKRERASHWKEIKGEKLLKLEEQGQACPPDMRGVMFLFPSNKHNLLRTDHLSAQQ